MQTFYIHNENLILCNCVIKSVESPSTEQCVWSNTHVQKIQGGVRHIFWSLPASDKTHIQGWTSLPLWASSSSLQFSFSSSSLVTFTSCVSWQTRAAIAGHQRLISSTFRCRADVSVTTRGSGDSHHPWPTSTMCVLSGPHHRRYSPCIPALRVVERGRVLLQETN